MYYTATTLGKWLVLRSAGFTPGTHIIVGWVDPRSSLDTKEWRKSAPLRHPGHKARSQRLAAWATWPLKKTMTWIQSPLSHLKETYNYIHCNVCKTTMPATLFVSKKELPLWVRKLSSIFGLKAVISPLAFGLVRFTTPLLQHLFAIRKRDSVTYGLLAGVSSAFRGEDNIPLFLTQRRLISKFIKTHNKCMKNSFKIIII